MSHQKKNLDAFLLGVFIPVINLPVWKGIIIVNAPFFIVLESFHLYSIPLYDHIIWGMLKTPKVVGLYDCTDIYLLLIVA